MAKVSTIYKCQQCGATSPKWGGQCSNCRAWNSMVEEIEVRQSGTKKGKRISLGTTKAVALSQVSKEEEQTGRLKTGSYELDRVLGGGMVPGSVILIAGEPGVGKSTLLTQLGLRAARANMKALYVCGEESPAQVSMRVDRLVKARKMSLDGKADNLLLLAELNVDAMIAEAAMISPTIMIVDSIQTISTQDLAGMAGSVGQVRECAMRLIEFAKRERVTIFLVGHVTREGTIAGPKVLEHMVDVVVNIWGDEDRQWRFLKTQKNRFGATEEVGVFEMSETGLADVPNPSGVFLDEIQTGVPGSAVAALMEGTRPILVEIQALVVESQLSMPRRVVNGIPLNKLQVLAAVLQKRCGLALGQCDIFVNVAGGLRIDEPAADLAIALAIASSEANVPLPKGFAAVGEVGLLGEIRNVGMLNRRVEEAKKMGIMTVVSPKEYRSIRDVIKAVVVKSGKRT